MEIINDLKSLLFNESKEAKQLNDTFTELDSHITKEARHIDRLDRITGINALKARLVSEIDSIKHEERSSEYSFNTSKVYSGILGFAIGGIVGAVLKQENPFSSGYKLCSKQLGEKANFGNVMMAIKESAKWEDIKVIAVSRLAREIKKTESDIISSLVSKDYSLVTPEELWKSLDQFKEEIRKGK